MANETQTIVIDNGSCFCKVGFSNENDPRSNFDSIVGYNKYVSSVCYEFVKKKEYYVGSNAVEKWPVLCIKHPVERGIICDHDYMEKVFNYIFSNELKIDQTDHPVIITETALNPKFSREWTTEIMFEKFNIPSFYTGVNAFFSLLSSGRKNGIVLESGAEVSCSVPIIDGNPIKESIIRVPIGGVDMTKYLMKLFKEREYIPYDEKHTALFYDIRKEIAYVETNFENGMKKAETTSDCNIMFNKKYLVKPLLLFNKERFMCSELLFQPKLDGLNFEGIDKAIFRSIINCKSDFHIDLLSNIVLSGGNSKLKGLNERIQKEIEILSGNKNNVHVISHSDTDNSAWKGASIFSSLSTSKQAFISREEYDECGSQIVNYKCNK